MKATQNERKKKWGRIYQKDTVHRWKRQTTTGRSSLEHVITDTGLVSKIDKEMM